MPDIDWNRRAWDTHSDWSGGGDEWSGGWGGPDSQWYWTLLPRVRAFVPAGHVLEIAPGFGRWTHYLKDLCRRLTVVDLSAVCIDACRKRFASSDHIGYHTNDGRSLDVVADGSVDFAFSFDSLVHAEMDVVEAYVGQLGRKLAPDGVAFLHHSNLGEYAARVSWADRLPVGRHRFERWGLVERNPNSRALSVTAAGFEAAVSAAGMRCVSQELFNWGASRRLSDCVSVFTPAGSRWARPNRVLRNKEFMAEARRAAAMSTYYGGFAAAPTPGGAV